MRSGCIIAANAEMRVHVGLLHITERRASRHMVGCYIWMYRAHAVIWCMVATGLSALTCLQQAG